MDSDSSPNPVPVRRHPLQTSLELLEPSSVVSNSPPPKQLPVGIESILSEVCATESSDIPEVIITAAEGENVDAGKIQAGSCENASEVISSTTSSMSSLESSQTSNSSSINPLSQSSAKQIKYQTKCMYERSVSWIKKIKLILKDSPLMLFGLASKQIPIQGDVIGQSKIIFEDYVYIRLREAGFGFNGNHENVQSFPTPVSGVKELNGLKISSSSADLNPKPILSAWQKGNGETYEQWHAEFVGQLPAVTAEIHNIGMKLETTYPSLYRNVSSQVCISPVKNEAHCRRIIVSLGDMMFKNGVVTWTRIIAIFSLASAVAVECYHHKEPRLIETVMTSVSEVMEKHAIKWIVAQGGWTDVTRAYREMNQEMRTLWALLGIGASVGFAFMWVTSQQW